MITRKTKKLTNKQKIDFIIKWSNFFYDKTDSYQDEIGEFLAYFWPAVAKDTYVEVTSNNDALQLLKENKIKDKELWKHIKIQEW